jgi:hypothetical protein
VPGAGTRARYVDCNLSLHRGVYTEKAWTPESLERAVFSCDYNGWADVPEEEREGVDAFEATRLPQRAVAPAPLMIRALLPAMSVTLQRRAA